MSFKKSVSLFRLNYLALKENVSTITAYQNDKQLFLMKTIPNYFEYIFIGKPLIILDWLLSYFQKSSAMSYGVDSGLVPQAWKLSES